MSDSTLDAFAATLAPTQYDKTEASTRRVNVQEALRKSTLNVTSMFESGSWSHGTAIKAKTDVDYMAVATGTKPTYPSSALTSAKTAMTGCDWKIIGVSASSPVVKVTYNSQPHFEIAPVWFKETKTGHAVYWIAGRGDEWVLSAPAAHLAYVNRENDRLSKRVKPLIRLLKAWKSHVGAPVSSFYMEMRAVEHSAGEMTIYYYFDLRSCFRKMINAEVRDMNDPEGIVGRIPACSSDDERRQTVQMMKTACSNLERAEDARSRNDKNAYAAAMRQVFGVGYPYPTW